MYSPSRVYGGVQGDFDGTFHNDSVLDTPIGTHIIGGKAHAEGDIVVSFDQSIRRPILFETQSQSVDGTEEVTQEWMVTDQLREYELKKCKKTLRFESDSNKYAEKEKQMRAADGAKGAKFAKFKKRLSFVAEEGGTPWRSPCVACMNKNLGKRAAEAGSKDPQRKRPHVSEGTNSGNDDFVLGDFVRHFHSPR
ncbi:hypothetical protein ZWY2020_058306 [Hordeum vulgare]|nr:hypothetical protein ZWY2020_058306 [Hordeum vulgare]